MDSKKGTWVLRFARHNDKRSALNTTNTAVSDWGNIVYNATIATAIAERLVENSEIFLLGGESLRKAIRARRPTNLRNRTGSDQASLCDDISRGGVRGVTLNGADGGSGSVLRSSRSQSLFYVQLQRFPIMLLLSRMKYRSDVVLLMQDHSAHRAYHLYDFTKSHQITSDFYYCLSRKVNGANKLYMVIESVKRNAEHPAVAVTTGVDRT